MPKDFASLEARLLAIGGTRVIQRFEPDLEILLDRGQEFEAEGWKKAKGRPCACHQNAALHYAWHLLYGRRTHKIVRGYGLSDDGLWRQHTWLWDGKRVLETTVPRDRYFGAILDWSEAGRFTLAQIVSFMPGLEAFRAVPPEHPETKQC